MGELLQIQAMWRHDKEPLTMYRNPDSRDRKVLLAEDDHRMIRFVLAGDGSLFAGNGFRFTHHDSHTALVNVYTANPYWSGELWLPGPHFPVGYGFTRRSDAEDRGCPGYGIESDPRRQHIDAEYNPRETALIARMGHYMARERGILDQSLSWRRFTAGLQLGFPKIEPIPGFRANEKITASTRAYVFLHGDGNVYLFDRDIDHFEAERALRDAERELYPRGMRSIHGTEAIVGMQLGGNGNMHLHFSEVSHPIEFMLDNRNFRECFGEEINFDVTESEVAIARHVAKQYALDRETLLGNRSGEEERSG